MSDCQGCCAYDPEKHCPLPPDECGCDPLDFGEGAPPLDFGHGVRGRWLVNADGVKIGLLESHPMPNPPRPGRRCFGSIYFDVPQLPAEMRRAATWTLNSLDPLDVSPSLLCVTCGHHGFIRQGRWEPV